MRGWRDGGMAGSGAPHRVAERPNVNYSGLSAGDALPERKDATREP